MGSLIYQQGFQGGRVVELSYGEGETLGDIRARLPVPDEIRDRVRVVVNGDAAPDELVPEAGDHVVFFLLPAGGDGGPKGVIGTVAMLGLALAAGGAPGAAFANAIGLGESVAFGRAILMMGGSLVLGLAQNALIKPPSQTEQPGGDPFFRFTGSRNQLSPWGWFPRVYGRYRVYPYLLAPPNITIEGSDQYIHLLFDFGYGPLTLSELSIGETPLGSFEDAEVNEYPEFDGTQDLQFFQSRSDYTEVGAAILQPTPVTRTTSLDTRRVNVTISFPAGLYAVTSKGKIGYSSVALLIEYSLAGANSWTPISDYQVENEVLEDEYTAQLTLVKGGKKGRYEYEYFLRAGVTQDFRITATKNNYYSTPAIGQRIRWYVPKLGWRPGVVAAVSGTLVTMTMDQAFPGTSVGIWDTQGYSSGRNAYRYCKGVLLDTPGVVVMRGVRRLPFDASIEFDLPTEDQYDIRITRLTPDYPLTSNILNATNWQALVSHVGTNKDLFNPEAPHHVLELRLRATDQLSGNVDTFNAIAESLLYTYSSGVPSAQPVATKNPAWAFVDVLMGSANKRPAPASRIDWPAIEAWAAECDGTLANDPEGFAYECNLLVQGDTTIRELLNTITATGRASPGRRDGKYTVVRDQEAQVPVQLITPKNSYGLSGSIGYLIPPHALKVQFTDALMGYRPSVAVVYNDGYSAANATVFEQLNLPGVTWHEQAWRLGRYWLAAGVLRRERVTVSMDIENLVATRGDLVILATDVLKTGGLPRKVRAVNGDQLTLDEAVAGSTLAIRRRGTDSIMEITLVSPTVIQLPAGEGANFVPGDVLEYGVTDQIKAPYLVESINPGPDLSAQLNLLEYRGEVQDAPTGTIPPRIPTPGTDPVTGMPLPVESLRVEYDYYVDDDRKRYMVATLRWNQPAKPVSRFLLTQLNGQLIDSTVQNYYELPAVNVSDLLNEYTRELSVLAQIDQLGVSEARSIVVTYQPYRERPADVIGFTANAQTETLALSWIQNTEEDLAGYQIRYSADQNATWENAAILFDSLPWTRSSAFAAVRSGWYFIKAYNTAEIYSENAAARYVDADEASQFQIIQTIDFAPFNTGNYIDTTEVNGELHLDQGQAAGGYYPIQMYTPAQKSRIRLISDITKTGQLVSVKLADLWFSPLEGAKPLVGPFGADDLVDAQVYFRYDQGGGNWTTFERLSVADIIVDTGGVEFAILLLTDDLDYYPVVSAATAKIARVARRESAYGVSVPSTGLSVTYAQPFAVRPAVQISLVDSAAKQYSTISNSTNTGFTVHIYGQSGSGIAGTIDWVAEGFGELF